MFGGQSGAGTVTGNTFADTWVLTNANGVGPSSWSPLTTSGGPPEGQYGVAGAYDPASDRFIVFGGTSGAVDSNAVWVLTDALNETLPHSWLLVSAAGAAGAPPVPENFLPVGYDPGTKKLMVLQSVLTAWSLSNADGTGTPAWTEQGFGTPPNPRAITAAVFDAASNAITALLEFPDRSEVWVVSQTLDSNQTPVAVAGPDQVLECTSPGPQLATVSADGSHDPDGDPLTFQWFDEAQRLVGTAIEATVSVPFGKHTYSVVVDDGRGATATASTNATVVDTTLPAFDPSSLADRTVVGSCTANPVAFALPSAGDACTRATVACGSVAGNSFGANTVTCTAADDSGNMSSAILTVNVLEPLHVVFLPPLADDSVADDVNGDADVSNLFRPGRTIPHKVRLLDCRDGDVTATVPVTVKLEVSQGAGGGGTHLINDLDDFNGIGDRGGSMVLVGDHYQFNLATNTVDYPSGGAQFQSLVTVSYRSAPGLVAGAEDARLVSR